ncbi:tetratricopeptide repeat protein [Catenulispora rubra]|uniref:tetratricopeptide repeat protein n=1 Tax=Catenulispora rubra TaxID=280293 RepID=UPI0018923167|nr:tetratricopeptide repeat protein [Catenulispora rubra]
MAIDPPRQAAGPSDDLAAAAAKARSLDDLAELLRALRRRHARAHRDSSLTYQELAKRTGWSQTAIAEYFTARTLPPTDRFDALVELLGVTPAEWRALAEARDRVEEIQRRAKARPFADSPPTGVRPGRTVPRQLPASTSLFTGREEELGRLFELIELAAGKQSPGTVVISAIDGMGGVGKTALALHAAHRLVERFPDGQLFLDLYGFAEDAAPREPGDALAVLLASLGLTAGQIPSDVDSRAAVYRERLAGTRTLVLLDNAADEAQVLPLLPAATGCLVLVTSRRRLKALDDALPIPLDVLPLEEAVALLRRAARWPSERSEQAEQSERSKQSEQPEQAGWEHVAELCGRLPLALVIVGALLRTGGKAWDLARLIERLTPGREEDALAGYTDEVRSLRSAFNLSYKHLSPDEQVLFRHLGLLPGPVVDGYAAAALLETDPATADLSLQRLADHSLLTGVSPGRYRLHDLVHAYAGTLATSLDSERDTARTRLLQYYSHTAQTASASIARHPRLTPTGPAPAFAPDVLEPEAARRWLRAEHGNLDAAFAFALAHGLDRHAIDLATGLAEILLADGPWSRSLEIHHAAAEIAERLARPADLAAALVDLGHARYLAGDYSGAFDAHSRALELQHALGNRRGQAAALHGIGRVQYMTEDDPAGAVASYSRALETHRLLADRRNQAIALTDLARVWYFAGDSPASEAAYVDALEIFRAFGDRLGEATALHGLGRIHQLAGAYPEALDAHVLALDIFRALSDRLGEAAALTDVGDVRRATGDRLGAIEAHTRALELFRGLGNRHGEAAALNYVGDVLRANGDFAEALDAHARALEINQDLGNRGGQAAAWFGLGRVRQVTGDHPGALDAHTQAMEIFRASGARGDEALVLNSYAATLAASGHRPRALELYRQALAVHRELGKPDDEAISLEGIGEHYLAVGDRAEGLDYLRQALEIYRRLGMRADADRVQDRLDD